MERQCSDRLKVNTDFHCVGQLLTKYFATSTTGQQVDCIIYFSITTFVPQP